MVIKPEEYSKQATTNAIISQTLGTTQTMQNMKYKVSPWDQDELIKYKVINKPKEIAKTKGITLVEDDPQVISRDEILPPDSLHDEAFQVRVGTNIFMNSVQKIKNDLETPGVEWVYAAPLPVLEKLKKPIPKPSGGHYLYRVVEGRHRWQATMEYKDFPCYIVRGHEADIMTLAQALNNPNQVTKKRDNDEASVQTTVQIQIGWYKRSKGKYGVKPDVPSIVEYMRENFNHIAYKNRPYFAEKCLAAEGILKDMDEYNQSSATELLKKFMPERTCNGTIDAKNRKGFLLRIGRETDELHACVEMLKSVIEYDQKGQDIPEHYFMGTITNSNSTGVRATHNPTSENLDEYRREFAGFLETHFMRKFIRPLIKLIEEDKIPNAKIHWLAQNNTKGETKDKTY